MWESWENIILTLEAELFLIFFFQYFFFSYIISSFLHDDPLRPYDCWSL